MKRHKRLFLTVGLILALIFSCSTAWAGDGALDTTFNMGSGSFAGVQNIPLVRGAVTYPTVTDSPYNNNCLVFGTFWGLTVGGYTQNNNCIARLTNTGTIDTNFVNNQNLNGDIRGVFIYPHNYPVAALQDKILIWGRFFAQTGSSQYTNLARLNANGSLDDTFPVINSYGGAVNSVAMQGGGFNGQLIGDGDKFLVVGYNLRTLSTEDGPACQLIRLNYDGSVDGGFTPWGAPNGYITNIRIFLNHPLFGNSVGVYCTYPKYDGSGTYYFLLVSTSVNAPSISNPPISFIDSTQVDGPIFATAMQSTDGKVVIGGQFQTAFGSSRKNIARLTYNSGVWTLDTGYDPGSGGTGGPNGVVTGISPMMTNSPYDDRMVVIGNFTTWNNNPCGYKVRLKTDGTLDTFNSGGTGADDRIRSINWRADGTGGWICGAFRHYNTAGTDYARGGITGLNADGTVNSSFCYGNFTANAGWPGTVYTLAAQSDGKIIIGGDFNGVDGKYYGGFARIYPNGSLDTSFIKGGVDGFVRSVAIQADGKILLGGQFGQCQSYACTSLARLNQDGSLDRTFQPLLVGHDNSLNDVYHVVPLSNGQIMIAGDIYDATSSAPLTRLNSNGSLDSSFWNNVSNIPNPIPGAEWVYGSRVAVAGNNYVIAGGYYYDTGTANGFLGRVTNSGELDTSFGPSTPANHLQTMDGEVDDMLLQTDGKIVVSGIFSHILDGSGSGPARSAIARFSGDGFLDGTFTPSLTIPSGANTLALPAMAWQPNGKILIEEHFLNYTGGYNYTYVSSQVARLNANGSLDPNFILGAPSQGWYYPDNGSCILRLPSGKALVGGAFSLYSSTPAFSLVRIYASPANFGPGVLMMFLDN